MISCLVIIITFWLVLNPDSPLLVYCNSRSCWLCELCHHICIFFCVSYVSLHLVAWWGNMHVFHVLIPCGLLAHPTSRSLWSDGVLHSKTLSFDCTYIILPSLEPHFAVDLCCWILWGEKYFFDFYEESHIGYGLSYRIRETSILNFSAW